MGRSALVQLAVFAAAAIVAAPIWYVLKLSVATAGCDWRDAQPGYFRAYCAVEKFGDYERAAYYFNLEPNATRHLAKAQVIFLGNSRTQFAFSTEAVRKFFELYPVPYYVMGFGHAERSEYPTVLLRKYRPPIKSIVVNTDPFFRPGKRSGPAQEVLNGSFKVYWVHAAKKVASPIQQAVCRMVPTLCGPPKTSFYRSEATGAWYTEGAVQETQRQRVAPPREPKVLSIAQIAELTANARAFLTEFAIDPDCAVFTSPPNERVDGISIAKALGQSVGAHVILPNLAGIKTLDGSHLDQQSAERWSAAFLQEYAPIMERCVNSSGAARPSQASGPGQ